MVGLNRGALHQPSAQPYVAKGTEPYSFSAHCSRSRPSPTQIAGTGARGGIPSCRRQFPAKGTTHTDFTGTRAPLAASRPRPAVSPTRIQLDVARLAQPCLAESREVSTSNGG